MQRVARIPGTDEPWIVLAGRYLGVLQANAIEGVTVPTAAVDNGINAHLFDPAIAPVLEYLASPAPLEELPTWFAEVLGMPPLPILDELEERGLLASFLPCTDLEEGLAQFDDVAFVPSLNLSSGQLPMSIRVTPHTPLPPDIPLSPWLTEADQSVESILLGAGDRTIRVSIEEASAATGVPLTVVYSQFSLMLVDLIAFGCGFLRRM